MILGGNWGVVFICFFLLCYVGNLEDKRKKREKEEGVEGNESDLIGVVLSGLQCRQGQKIAKKATTEKSNKMIPKQEVRCFFTLLR